MSWQMFDSNIPRAGLSKVFFDQQLRRPGPPSMPPNIVRATQVPWIFTPTVARTIPSHLPFLYPQQRSASILSGLSDNPTAYHKKIRRGRGPSSGKGKTSGRGHKGQKQHGKVPRGFNGGQTPDEVVHGVRGFENQ